MIGLILICNFLFGQSLQSIKNQVDSNRLDIALKEVTTFQISPENEVEYYLLVSDLYYKIAKSTEFNNLVAEPIKLSFENILRSYQLDNQLFIRNNAKYNLSVLAELQLMSFRSGMKMFTVGQQSRQVQQFHKAALSLKLAKSIMDFRHNKLSAAWSEEDQLIQIYYTKTLILIENEQDALINAKFIFNNIENFHDNLITINGIAQWLDQYYRQHRYDEKFIGFNNLASDLFQDSYFLMSRIEYYQSRLDTLGQIESFQKWKSQSRLNLKFYENTEYQYIIKLYYNYIFNNIDRSQGKNKTVNVQRFVELLEETYASTKNFETGLLLVKTSYNLLVIEIRGDKRKSRVWLKKEVTRIIQLCNALKLLHARSLTGNMELEKIEENLKRIAASN
jgi:hypothetical protein